jgi:hypothetical protein
MSLLLAPICNLRETNGTAAGCCILPSSVGMRRKKGQLCVYKLRERNGTVAGCCILSASAGKRRWNGRQRTEIVGRWHWAAMVAGAPRRCILSSFTGDELR